MNNQGDITFSQIVYAALALAILVVLLLIFTGQLNKFGNSFDRTAEPTQEAATRAGWCIGTITSGRQCSYDLSCDGIRNEVGMLVRDLGKTPEKDACKKDNEYRFYSSKDQKFCCGTRS